MFMQPEKARFLLAKPLVNSPGAVAVSGQGHFPFLEKHVHLCWCQEPVLYSKQSTFGK